MNPADLLDIQGRLSEGLAADRDYREHCARIMAVADQALKSDMPSGVRQSGSLDETAQDNLWLLDHESDVLRGAHTFHASADMSAVVRGASEALAAQERFTLDFAVETVPTTSGFAMLETDAFTISYGITEEGHDDAIEIDDLGDIKTTDPFLIRSIRTQMHFCAFSWSPVVAQARDSGIVGEVGAGDVAGMRFTFYASAADHLRWLTDSLSGWTNVILARNERDTALLRDEVCPLLGISYEQLEAHNPRTDPPLPIDEGNEEALGHALKILDRIKTSREGMIDPADLDRMMGDRYSVSSARYGFVPVLTLCWMRAPHEIVPAEATDVESIKLLTLAWTFFHMCGQTIAARDSVIPSRASSRRWRRMPMPKLITVVRLRRESAPYDPDLPHSDVHWNHRWLVRGHWRMQACGIGRTERRPTWIHGYVKGPEGAPLVVTNKVYDLVR